MSSFKPSLIFLSLLSLPATAQDVRTDAAGPHYKTLDSVVVTASRTAEKREDVASSVEVITAAELDDTVGLSFIDLLKKNVALDVIQYPNGLAGIGLRGLRPDFEFTINPRTLVLVDGRPSGSTSFTTIAPESIERVEVLRGPASALYGASAVGGVVNIITRRSSGPVQGEVNVGLGSFQTRRSGIRVGGTLTGNTDFDLALGYVDQAGDFSTGDGERRPYSHFRRGSGRLRIGSDLSPIVRIDTDLDFANLDNQTPGPLSFDPQTPSANITNRVSGDVRLEVTPDDHSIRLVAYGSREDYHYYQAPVDAARYLSSNTLSRYWGAQVQDSWQMTGPLRLIYGLDWQKVTATPSSYAATGWRKAPYSPNESRQTRAVFAELRLSLLDDRVQLTAGGRHDWITVETLQTPFRPTFTPGTAKFGVFDPRGGIVVKLGDGLRVHGTIGRAFVPAQGIQLAGESEEFAGQQRRLTMGNARLRPERNTTWDAGLGYANSWVNADLTYFDSRTRDRITTTLVSETPTLRMTSYINANRSRSRGLEGNLSLDAGRAFGFPAGRFVLNGNATHLYEARDFIAAGAPTPIRNVADWKATGSATVSNDGGLAGTVTVRYNGARQDTDNSQGRLFTDGAGGLFIYERFITVDLSAQWRATAKDTFRVELANLLDRDYYEKADYPMPGRALYLRYARSF